MGSIRNGRACRAVMRVARSIGGRDDSVKVLIWMLLRGEK